MQADRSCRESSKRAGGGIAIYVNNRWRNPDTSGRVWIPDIELLAVGLRPYYLPCEFSHAIILCVYNSPTVDSTQAADVVPSSTARLQTLHPEAFIAISRNYVTMDSTLPKFKQFVDCKTRENKTLDLLYANVKEAYSTIALPPLGKSHHNLVYLKPQCIPAVQQQPVTTRTVLR